MPWLEATLRGQKVLARVRTDGSLEASGGRVEIRYRAGDGKAYRASISNLTVAPAARLLPDDACAAEGPAVPRRRPAKPAERRNESAIEGSSARAGWVVYTDGACSGNPGPAGAGMVVIAPDGKIHEGYEYLGSATNNVAEITGVMHGVLAVPKSAERIAIYTDSKYAIGVLSLGWKAKANAELVGRAREALAGRNVRFVHVPGHAGVPMNERADELAREAIRRSASRPLPKLDPPVKGA
jgi:ribonuclease HI